MTLASSPEHITHALWQQRQKFRALFDADMVDEICLLESVRADLRGNFYHDLTGAVSFYRDLNTTTLQEQRA